MTFEEAVELLERKTQCEEAQAGLCVYIMEPVGCDDFFRYLRYDEEQDTVVDVFGAEPLREGWVSEYDEWKVVCV